MVWQYGMIWHGMVGYTVSWRDMIWPDMTWFGMAVRNDMVFDMIWRDMIWGIVLSYGMTWYQIVWSGNMEWYGWHRMIWYGMVSDTSWYKVMWHDMFWTAVVWIGMIWYSMVRDVMWHDGTLYDVISCDVISCDVSWYDMVWRCMIWCVLTWYYMAWYDWPDMIYIYIYNMWYVIYDSWFTMYDMWYVIIWYARVPEQEVDASIVQNAVKAHRAEHLQSVVTCGNDTLIHKQSDAKPIRKPCWPLVFRKQKSFNAPLGHGTHFLQGLKAAQQHLRWNENITWYAVPLKSSDPGAGLPRKSIS